MHQFLFDVHKNVPKSVILTIVFHYHVCFRNVFRRLYCNRDRFPSSLGTAAATTSRSRASDDASTTLRQAAKGARSARGARRLPEWPTCARAHEGDELGTTPLTARIGDGLLLENFVVATLPAGALDTSSVWTQECAASWAWASSSW